MVELGPIYLQWNRFKTFSNKFMCIFCQICQCPVFKLSWQIYWRFNPFYAARTPLSSRRNASKFRCSVVYVVDKTPKLRGSSHLGSCSYKSFRRLTVLSKTNLDLALNILKSDFLLHVNSLKKLTLCSVRSCKTAIETWHARWWTIKLSYMIWNIIKPSYTERLIPYMLMNSKCAGPIGHAWCVGGIERISMQVALMNY